MAQYDIVFHVNANASGELFAERKVRLQKGELLGGSADYPVVIAARTNGVFLFYDSNSADGFSTSDKLIADTSNNSLKTTCNYFQITGTVPYTGIDLIATKGGANLQAKDLLGRFAFHPKGDQVSYSAIITAVATSNHTDTVHPTALAFGTTAESQSAGANDMYRFIIDRNGNLLVKTSGIDITGTLPDARSGVDIHDSVGFGPTIQASGNQTMGDGYCYMLTNAATGNATFYLPDLASVEGRNYMVVNATGTRTITIARAGTDKINGVTNPSIVLNAGDVVFIHATGNPQYGWFVSGNVKR